MLTFNFNPFPTLTTERLQLRKTTLDDLHDFFHFRNTEEGLKYVDRPKQSLQETEAILHKTIAAVENNENISWGIALKNTPKLIGTIGFWRTIKEHHRAEIGYILSPEYWNSGIMTEAMRAVLKYGFDEMKLHSVEANVNPENAASIRLLEKCGFVKEAHFRENYYFDGKFLDSAIYSLLCSWYGPS